MIHHFLASFTTCWASLQLYEALELRQDRCLYFDTNSVEFTSHTGQHNPPLGQFLGQFKDELNGNDSLKNFYRATRNKATKHIKKMYAADSEAFHSAEVKEALDQPPETRVPKTCQTCQIKPGAKKYELYPFAQ